MKKRKTCTCMEEKETRHSRIIAVRANFVQRDVKDKMAGYSNSKTRANIGIMAQSPPEKPRRRSAPFYRGDLQDGSVDEGTATWDWMEQERETRE